MTARKSRRGLSQVDDDSSSTHIHSTVVGGDYIIVRHTHIWHPPTDVFEDGGRLVVVTEVAGMQDGQFSVLLDDGSLTISGTRPPLANKKPAFHQMEVRHGEFRVELKVPWAVDEAAVEASYSDGFLRVELPRMDSLKLDDAGTDKPEIE